MGQKSLSGSVLLEGWSPTPTFSAGKYRGSWLFHYSSWLCGHPLQLTNAKTGACFDWAVICVRESNHQDSQVNMRGDGESERFDAVSLSQQGVRSSARC